jgi:phage baseplate assembly protein gpV
MLSVEQVVIRDDTNPFNEIDRLFMMFKCGNHIRYDYDIHQLKNSGRFDSDLIYLSQSENAQKLLKGEL